MSDYYYNTFIIYTCIYGLFGHEYEPGDIGKVCRGKIGCSYCVVYLSVVFSVDTKLFLYVTQL